MKVLNINDYRYDLPQESIALYPLADRDDSRLLVWAKKNITHSYFKNIADFLPDNTLLFFNDTKVIPARIHFKKDTGADIEIFLLSPIEPSPVISVTMQSTASCAWKCTVGNLKRWRPEVILKKDIGGEMLKASLLNREEGIVQFTWSENKSFGEVVALAGETPLPPYLRRAPEKTDRERYQTIYSHYEGAVAAPTAGLHFTEKVFNTLKKKNIQHDFLTLHVSAGTFQPVKTENAEAHIMHPEQIRVTLKNVENLLLPKKFVIAVGTTSIRTLESLYWFGVKILQNPLAEFKIAQDDPYVPHPNLPSPREAMAAVRERIKSSGFSSVEGETSIFIKPGYQFKICSGLITNFHQPASTLMLLVAAFIGDEWKKVYRSALDNNYRFLSYGDSSLLIP